ncbi:MAG: chalcone isomerase family protein [Flavobacteriales bacterium]|nr:chalcone isomerase family protein [Flavobacteriales bacterium]
MKTILTIALAAMMTPVFSQVTLNDVTVPASVKAGDHSLKLNGAGIRKKAFFKLYVAGLYTPKKSADANALINADEPIGIRLQITSGMVSSDNMSEAIAEGFKKSTGGKTAPLQSKIDQFVANFKKEAIVEGNIFELFYVPGKGVQTLKNGKLLTTIDGLDFKKALFGIWLSNDPVDADLKKGLLGS